MFLMANVALACDCQVYPPTQDEPLETPKVENRSRSGYKIPVKIPVYVWDVVKFGDRGEDVKTLQMYLNNKGANLKVDGIYGILTQLSVNLIVR